jgi:DNA uptake protein ComE-like DNA-binding protein
MLKWLQQLFVFTKGEQRGIVVLVVLCILAFIAPRIYLYVKPVSQADNSAAQQQVAAFIAEYERDQSDRVEADTDDVQPAKYISAKATDDNVTQRVVDINKATATDFEKLRGIGPVLAARIVKFRGVLGGFASVAQLREVYGLPDSTYQAISGTLKVQPGQVQQLNINTGSYKDFKAHPYLRPFAKDIESYRNKNGNYKQVADLKNITGITDSIYRKMTPYITVE